MSCARGRRALGNLWWGGGPNMAQMPPASRAAPAQAQAPDRQGLRFPSCRAGGSGSSRCPGRQPRGWAGAAGGAAGASRWRGPGRGRYSGLEPPPRRMPRRKQRHPQPVKGQPAAGHRVPQGEGRVVAVSPSRRPPTPLRLSFAVDAAGATAEPAGEEAGPVPPPPRRGCLLALEPEPDGGGGDDEEEEEEESENESGARPILSLQKDAEGGSGPAQGWSSPIGSPSKGRRGRERRGEDPRLTPPPCVLQTLSGGRLGCQPSPSLMRSSCRRHAEKRTAGAGPAWGQACLVTTVVCLLLAPPPATTPLTRMRRKRRNAPSKGDALSSLASCAPLHPTTPATSSVT